MVAHLLADALHSGRSVYQAAAAVNYATHSLYNNSGSAYYVAVHGFGVFQGAGFGTGAEMFCAAAQGTFGSSLGTISPLLVGEAKPPVLHYYQDQAALLTPDCVLGSQNGAINLALGQPIVILQPGWSFQVQTTTQAATTIAGFFFTWFGPEELPRWHRLPGLDILRDLAALGQA